MKNLLDEIRKCKNCDLPHMHRPIVQASSHSSILLIGQAPGRKVHETGVPWNDASGKNLRKWLGVSEEQFYDPRCFALVPMGFCYPGHNAQGDLPPRPECAPLWHKLLLEKMPKIKLTILLGKFAQHYYLQAKTKKTLTETVRNYETFLPEYLPLPHPSPRNSIWLKKNPWFEAEVLPLLREVIDKALAAKA